MLVLEARCHAGQSTSHVEMSYVDTPSWAGPSASPGTKHMSHQMSLPPSQLSLSNRGTRHRRAEINPQWVPDQSLHEHKMFVGLHHRVWGGLLQSCSRRTKKRQEVQEEKIPVMATHGPWTESWTWLRGDSLGKGHLADRPEGPLCPSSPLWTLWWRGLA